MRNLKKILALVLALVMSFSLMATANAFTDSDKINGTYEEAVEVLSGLKVFQGYDNGSFVPQGSITRAEVATIIYRIVTGDVADKQVGIYADYNKFDDVKSTSWYAGYVNFCANAEYIKGYDAKTFGPNDPVTGYQALAMILRAVGYDKNGEFTGAGWQTQTAAVGKKLGITDNVSEGTLGVAATREVVAEILFRTIMVPQVEYTVAFGYQSIGKVSIGYETFGLAYAEGIVTGNQATGAAATVVSKDYVANTTTDLRFGTKTDLNMIGHSVKVWYDARTSAVANGVYGTVYTLMDKSTAETVLTSAELLGKVDAKTAYSYNYGAFNRGTYLPSASKFVVIDGGKAVISVDEYAAKIHAINNFAVTPTVTMQIADAQGDIVNNGVVYKQSALTGFNKDTMTVNKIVIVTKIDGKELYNLQLVEKSVKGIVRFYDAQGNVTLSDGTVLARSSANLYNSAAPFYTGRVNAFSTLETYVFVLDADGRYLAALPSGSDYLFGTYAYYTIDNAATAQLSYYLTGVTADGQVVTKKITADDYNNAQTVGQVPNLSTQNQNITNAGNAGRDFSMKETATTDIYNVANSVFSAVSNPTTIGNIYRNASQPANITKDLVAFGPSHNYFVDETTKFYFVSGTAAQPQVQEIVGKTALLGSGDVYVLPANSVVTTSVLNYSVNTAANFHVDTVLVKAPYAANAAADLYYLNAQDNFNPGITSGSNTQIGVHKNAKVLSPVWVTTATANALGRSLPAFYTHTANAAGIETLTRIADDSGVIKAYYGVTIDNKGTSNMYVTRGNQIINRVASDAVVVDLRAGVNSGAYLPGQNLLVEVKTVADLVAQSAEYTFTVDAAGTAGGVTIVYVLSSQIRDTAAQFNVNVSVIEADGNTATTPTNFYEVVEGSLQVPYNGLVSLSLKDAAKGAAVTVNGVALAPTYRWIGGNYVPVYHIGNITENKDVVITVPSNNAGLGKVTIDGTSVTVAAGAATAADATATEVTVNKEFTMVATAANADATVYMGSGTTVDLAEGNLAKTNTVTVTDSTSLNGGDRKSVV